MNAVINDKQGSRFVLSVEGNEVYVLYTEDKETVELYSTYTPPQLRGKGLASVVVKAALEYAKGKKLKVVPACWYVRKFIEENQEYQGLVN